MTGKCPNFEHLDIAYNKLWRAEFDICENLGPMQLKSIEKSKIHVWAAILW